VAATRVFRNFRELLDVDFGTPADGDAFVYDQPTDSIIPGAVTTTGLWAGAPAGGKITVASVAPSSPAVNDLWIW
jgi:hypothetical protein